VRQREAAERTALAQLRDGDVAKAVASYARRGRIVVAPDRVGAIEKLIEGWASDVGERDSVAMYAYRRANVAELNRRAVRSGGLSVVWKATTSLRRAVPATRWATG
jgi:hypothetical protein